MHCWMRSEIVVKIRLILVGLERKYLDAFPILSCFASIAIFGSVCILGSDSHFNLVFDINFINCNLNFQSSAIPGQSPGNSKSTLCRIP